MHDEYKCDQMSRTRLALAAAAVVGVAALGAVFTRRRGSPAGGFDAFGFNHHNEQAITIKSPLELVEAAWADWCATGGARLSDTYTVRFEPAPGARGTEVHLSGGGSKGRIRQELRRFKQVCETGEVTVSDGPGLWRAARPAKNVERARTLSGVQS